MTTDPAPLSRLTRGIKTGIATDPAEGAVVPPLYLSSTYTFAEFGQGRTHEYGRTSNPTRTLLAEALTTLEDGAGAVVCPTGMAAITLVVHALTVTGATVAIPHDCYGGTWRLFATLAEKGYLRVVTVDFTDERSWRAALSADADAVPDLVWLETPSNPLLRLTDLDAVAAQAHAVGARVVADNTFLTPLLQRPLAHGVDVVVHSTTKFLNGHSDVVGGAAVAATPELAAELDDWANNLGLVGAPFDSYLTLRGLRTVQVRLRAHQENAAAVAETAVTHPAAAAVHWPGLATHPQHDLAKRQQDGFGAMLSIELAGGLEAARAFCTGLRVFSLAESLGGVESLVAHPTTMTHASMAPEARAAAGIGDGLVRLSVGIEETDDLRADLIAALDRAAATRAG